LCGVAVALTLSACGGGQLQSASEPSGKFKVQVSSSFPTSQRLSQATNLVIKVTNVDAKTIPDVAVTICNVTCAYPAPQGEGSSAGAFASDIDQTQLANPSRPLWVVDRGPGPCGYSCRNGGQGAGVTAYANTWALGRLAPGKTARFDWAVTAVHAGSHTVAWQVAAGLNGRAKAVLGDGSKPRGTFVVHVSSAAPQTYVNNAGKIVNAS
jgi:hypothetical protein